MDRRLDSVLTDILEERAFSLEAADAIKELRDSLKQTEQHNDALQQQVETSERIRAEQAQMISERDRKIAAMEEWKDDIEQRELDVKKREYDFLKVQLERDLEKQRVQDHKDILLSLTRNLQHRKELYTSVNGYDSQGSTNENTTVTETHSTE